MAPSRRLALVYRKEGMVDEQRAIRKGGQWSIPIGVQDGDLVVAVEPNVRSRLGSP